jgi:divalent metal cation (Fe/Co/Zn/Cd) transporter
MSDADDQLVQVAGQLQTGVRLERCTLAWNVAGVVILAVLSAKAHSVALFGFGLDSLVEIGASIVVLWELRSVGVERERRALSLIAVSFVAISAYLAVQSTVTLVHRSHAHHSPLGITWTGATAIVMFALAWSKASVGRATQREVLLRESRVTFIDGLLAVAILSGLSLNAFAGWWWADPAATYVIVVYGFREALQISSDLRSKT